MLLIISGPSGVGKTTITRAIERAVVGSVFSVSVTTRQKTVDDAEGVDYRFVTDEQFEQMVANDELLEHADVFGKKYGTPRDLVEEHLSEGRLVILEIDVNGAEQVKARQIVDPYAVDVTLESGSAMPERLRERIRALGPSVDYGEAERKRLDAAVNG